MNYKYFVPSTAFEQAVIDKDKEAIKMLLIQIVGGDPTFETTEYSEACTFVKEKWEELHGELPGLNQKYKKQEDEYELDDPDKWTEEYFELNLVWLRDNFAVKERMTTIRKIGKEVYREKKTLGKIRKQQLSTPSSDLVKNSSAVPVSTSGKKSKWISIGTIASIALIAVIIAIIYFQGM